MNLTKKQNKYFFRRKKSRKNRKRHNKIIHHHVVNFFDAQKIFIDLSIVFDKFVIVKSLMNEIKEFDSNRFSIYQIFKINSFHNNKKQMKK